VESASQAHYLLQHCDNTTDTNSSLPLLDDTNNGAPLQNGSEILQSSYNILFSDGVSRLGLDPFFEVSVSKNSKVSGLGLEGF